MSAAPRKTRGFTLIELLVVIGIIGVLLAVLVPALAAARRAARAARCLSNLHQVSMGFAEYADDHHYFLPESTDPWEDTLQPYIPDRSVFVCPDDGGEVAQAVGISYLWRNDVTTLDENASLAGRNLAAGGASSLVLVFDAFADWHGRNTHQGAAVDASAHRYAQDEFNQNLEWPAGP